jgi:hypothetical protein
VLTNCEYKCLEHINQKNANELNPTAFSKDKKALVVDESLKTDEEKEEFGCQFDESFLFTPY